MADLNKDLFKDAPAPGDYVQLLDAQGNPSENHTSVERWTAKLGEQLYLIQDPSGESFAVTRLPEMDTQVCRAWQQTITSAPLFTRR
jgi:hypothetical protein